MSSAVVWHDVECGAYSADLDLWEELAAAAGGPVLDLGCGTGRVALHLGRRGHEVVGVDLDPLLVAAFNERSAATPAEALAADARELQLDRRFDLAIAPMQLLQLFEGPCQRVAMLEAVARHLRPRGLLAMAIVEEAAGWEASTGAPPPLPDSREVGGVVYSSLPLATRAEGEAILVRRLRQSVDPAGNLSEELNVIRLASLTADRLELEAESAGLSAQPRRYVGASEAHVGSTVVVCRREA